VRTPFTIGLVLLTLVLVGVLVLLLAPNKNTLEGTLDLSWTGDSDGMTCSGSGGYDDIYGGQTVVVKDSAGKTVATGDLQEGEPGEGVCTFAFTVENVAEEDYYEVSTSGRDGITYSHDELEAQDWDIGLSLGD
jgi:hypothetical protein